MVIGLLEQVLEDNVLGSPTTTLPLRVNQLISKLNESLLSNDTRSNQRQDRCKEFHHSQTRRESQG